MSEHGWMTSYRSLQGEYLLELSFQENELVIQAYRGRHPVLITWLVRQFPILEALAQRCTIRDNRLYAALSQYGFIRDFFRSLDDKHFTTYIDPNIIDWQEVSPPEDFILQFAWSGEQGEISLVQDKVAYAGNGWFRAGKTYWRIPDLGLEDDFWLMRSRIRGQDVIVFLKEVVPAWHQRGLAVDCPVLYEDSPVFALEIKELQDDEIIIEVTWFVDPQSIQPVIRMPGYVWCENTLRPGIHPQELPLFLRESGEFRVKDNHIIDLFQAISQARLWTGGQVDEFKRWYGRWRQNRSTGKPITGNFPKKEPEFIQSLPSSAEKEFLWEATLNAGDTGERAPFVPLADVNVPLYSKMSLAMRQWYFYWRSQARQGRYLPTAMGYLLLYICELINNIGTTPSEGYQWLKSLWEHYQGEYPYIDSFVRDWIVDYAVVNNCNVDPLELYAYPAWQNVVQNVPPHYVDIALNRALTQDKGELTADLLKFYLGQDWPAEKLVGLPQEEALAQLPQILQRLDAISRQESGRGLWERQRVPRTHLTRFPFEGAHYGFTRTVISLGEFPQYSRSQKFRHFLAQIVSYIISQIGAFFSSEALSVEVASDGEELPPELRQQINWVLTVEFGYRKKLDIDLAKVAELATESQEVQRILLGEESSEGNESDAADESDGDKPVRPEPVSPPQESKTDLPEEWQGFQKCLEAYELAALRVLAAGIGGDKLEEIAAKHLLMKDLLIDNLNEKALDTIGDLVVDPEGPAIVDEYLPMIKALVAG